MRLTWLRRRGWIVGAAMLGCAGAALAIAAVIPDRHSAEAVVIVPAASDENALGNIDQAAKLANTYSLLIPRDQAVLAAIATEVGLGQGSVEERLTAEHDAGNALLRLQFRGESGSEAVLGARAAAEAVAGSAPVSENIEPSSMTLVRLPSLATRTGELPLAFVAESVVLVPARAPRNPPGNAGEASNLATTYADLIPEDRVIMAKVALDLGLESEDVRQHSSVTKDFDTSIIRLLFENERPEVALAGARLLAESVAGAAPVSPRIAPRSLAIVHLPTETTSEALSPAKAVILGLILGFALGIVLLLAWERADGRVDDVKTLSGETRSAASSLKQASHESIQALLKRWVALGGGRGPTRVALLPASQSSEAATATTAASLDQAGFLLNPASGRPNGGAKRNPAIVLKVGGTPGTPAAGEALALEADLIVLVAAEGMRIADLRATMNVLEQFGGAPAWALLVPRRVVDRNGRRMAQALRQPGQQRPVKQSAS